MKRLLSLLLTSMFIINLNFLSFAASPETILSESFVVMDAGTGQVLLAKNENEKMYPASITKILTCALILEKGNPNDVATMTNEIVKTVPRDTSHIALTDGEQIPVKDLLYAAMLPSANDAAHCLAFYLSGSMEDFADEMNKKAKEIGAISSNFVNSSGLHDENHYTTAMDMATITKWALSVDGFRELFECKEYTMAPTNLQKQERYWATKQKLLYPELKSYYEGATGGKTGWTPEAQHTMVSVAKKDGVELICVALKTSQVNEKFDDTKKLFDEAFNTFDNVTFQAQKFAVSPIPIMDGKKVVGEVKILPNDIMISKPKTIAKASVDIKINVPKTYNQGELINPTVTFSNSGKELAQSSLEYEISKNDEILPAVSTPKTKVTGSTHKWAIATIATLLASVALLFLIRAYNLHRKKIRKKQKCEARYRKNLQNTAPKRSNKYRKDK